jgi:hypothetical protein
MRDWASLDLKAPRAKVSAGYTPPPPTVAPPAGWRPQPVVQPTPPRTLPAQDASSIDEAEERAARLTVVVAALAAAIMTIMLGALWVQLVH